jgi:hypothetical protein
VSVFFFLLVLQTHSLPHRLKLSIVLATPILIFRPQSTVSSMNDRLVFHLGHIHIEQAATHCSIYEIKINHVNLFSIDLEHECRHNQGVNLIRMYKNPHLPLPILDNISIHLDLHLTDILTTIDSKLVTSVQMFLGKHQITLLQNIISSLTYDDDDEPIDIDTVDTPDDESLVLFDDDTNCLSSNVRTSTNKFTKFAIRFQLPELILVFQSDLDLKPTKVCEAIFGQFQMSIEQQHQFCKTISLRLNSLHINDHLVKVDRCLFSTRCRKCASTTGVPSDSTMTLLSTSTSDNTHDMNEQQATSSTSIVHTDATSSSTWNLLSSSLSMTTTPAFIDINIILMDKRHDDYRGFNIIADAQFGEVNIEFIISTWVMLFDIIGLIGGPPSSISTSKNRICIR